MATVTRVPIHPTNFEAGRKGYKIEGVVVHIMQGTLAGTDEHFKTYRPGAESSSHEGIGKNGDVHIYVEPQDTAYHAGRFNNPTWPGMKKNLWGGWINANAYTYGIECEGWRGERWTEEQMVSLTERVKLRLQTSSLPFTRRYVISHNEITADKEDVRDWCDEIVKRMNTAPLPAPVDREAIKRQIKELVDKL